MVEHNVAVHVRLYRGVAVTLLLCVQDVEQAGGADGGFAELPQEPAQVPGRPDQHGIIGGKGQEFPLGEGAPFHKEHACHDDDQHLESGHKISQAPVDAHDLSKLYPKVGKILVFLIKAVDFELFPPESAHNPYTGEVFLHQRGEFALSFVRHTEAAAGDHIKPQGDADDNGQKRRDKQREFHVHGEHQRQGNRNQQHGADAFHQLVAHKVTHQIHILGTALDDIAGLMGIVPGVGQMLDMVEQGVADSCHRTLAGTGQVHAGSIVRQPGKSGEKEGDGRADHNVGAQHFPAANSVDPGGHKAWQVKGIVVNHRIHGYADHLRGHVVGDDRHYHHQHGDQEFGAEPLCKGIEPQDIGLLLGLFVFHIIPLTHRHAGLFRRRTCRLQARFPFPKKRENEKEGSGGLSPRKRPPSPFHNCLAGLLKTSAGTPNQTRRLLDAALYGVRSRLHAYFLEE